MGVWRSESAVRGFWAALATGMAAIVITALTILFGQSRGVISSPAPESTVTRTTTATATVTATPVSTATTAERTGASQASTEPANEVRTQYLDELEPVEDELEARSASFDGVDYPQSLTNPMSGCSEVGPVTWVLPEGSQRVLADVGVDIGAVEPNSRVTFIVRVGSAQVYSRTLGVGEHAKLDLAVEPGRLEVETTFIPDGGFRNNCNTEAVAVWGDLRIQMSSTYRLPRVSV